MLPVYIAVSEASPTGLVYTERRGKRHQTKTHTLEAAVEWVNKKREELHDSEFVRHS